MTYRYGDRLQMNLFPQSVEDYVAQDDPVRVFDAFVETLDLSQLGITVNENKEGNPEYNPKTMLKLLLYGCSYGIRSSRKLERACYHNVSFMWLTGGLKPDHKTISEFRKNNKKALKNIIKQCAKLCIKLELIEGNTLFVDGTKIRANAGISNTFTKERAGMLLQNIDRRIEQILDECDSADEKEFNDPSLVKLKDELADKEILKAKIESIVKELSDENKESVNATDKDCVKVKGRQGVHAGYNAQIVVDSRHGLIVNSDVVNKSNDSNQLSSQTQQANEVMSRACVNVCSDAGYTGADDLKKIDDKGINVIVPSQMQARDRKPSPFDKEHFAYDRDKDCYVCPCGHILRYTFFEEDRMHRIYQIADKSLCTSCKHFGLCTSDVQGRRIRRLVNEDVKLKLEQRFKEQQSQAIYKQRKEKVEHPFGHIKRNLGVTSFLLRGLDGVGAEMSLFSSCFNILRMVTICCGVKGFIARLST